MPIDLDIARIKLENARKLMLEAAQFATANSPIINILSTHQATLEAGAWASIATELRAMIMEAKLAKIKPPSVLSDSDEEECR